MTTLVINTKNTSRKHWNDVRVALNRNGFEVHRFHSQITDGGMTLVAEVFRPQGEGAARAKVALSVVDSAATLRVLQ